MKTTLSYLSLLMLCCPSIFGQVECHTPDPGEESTVRIINVSSDIDCQRSTTGQNTNNEFYVPDANTPIKTVRINFHVMQKTDGTGNFDENNVDHMAHSWEIEDWVNDKFTNMHEPLFGGATGDPYVLDSRIRVKLQAIYFEADDFGWNNNQDQCGEYSFNNHKVNEDQELNIFFVRTFEDPLVFIPQTTDMDGCGMGLIAEDKNFVTLSGLYDYYLNDPPGTLGPNHLGGKPWVVASILTHEICHCLGLGHSWYAAQKALFPDLPNQTSQNSECDPWTDPNCSNNIMGYANTRNWITPLQMGHMHQLASGGWRTKMMCECNHGAVTLQNITSDETWEWARLLDHDLHITNNSTLTIKCKVSMPEQGKIVVEPGSKLVIDGGIITNSCGQMWRGIEVHGSGSQAQSESYDGTVVLKNGAIIEYATRAIQLGESDLQSGVMVLGTSTGILRCSDATFRNCRSGIYFGRVPNVLFDNTSYIKDSEFVTDDELNQGPQAIETMINLDFNNGVQIEGNTFINQATSLYSPESRGIGIASNSSVWRAERYCDSQVVNDVDCDFGTLHPNHFENLWIGVNAQSMNNVTPFVIDNATFVDCFGGVNMEGVHGAAILSCTFSVPSATEIDPEASYGVSALLCDGWEIEDNKAIGPGDGSPTVGYAIHGSVGNNAIENNSGDNLHTATLIMGKNSNANFSIGLQILCNNFGQLSGLNQYDVALNGVAPNLPSIQENQGEGGLDAEDPAGNLFSHNPTSGTYDWYIESGVHDIIYNRHSNIDEPKVEPVDFTGGTWLDIVPFGVEYDPVNSCILEIGTHTGSTVSHVLKVNSIDDLLVDQWDYYNDRLDNGSTRGLLAFVQDVNNSSMEVRNALVAASPYVSATVWQAAFNRNPSMDSWHLAMALVESSPLKPSVRQMMYSSGVDPFYQQLVNAAQNGGISATGILESEISSLTLEREQEVTHYLRNLLTDSLTNGTIAELMTLLDPTSRVDHALSTFGLHVLDGNNSSAQSILTNCSSYPISDDVCETQQIWLDEASTDLSFQTLTGNQIADLQAMADDLANPACAYARSILRAHSETLYDPVFYFPGGVLRDLEIANPHLNSDRQVLNVYPNPSSKFAYAVYECDPGVEYAEFVVIDTFGKQIHRELLQGSFGIIELNNDQMSNGVYLCSLYWDGILVESQKLTVVK